MAVQTVHLSRQKLVFVSTEVPDECVRRAQVVIVSEAGWHLIGPAPYRAHGLGNAMPLPEVTCPVVDVSAVKDDLRMKAVLDVTVTHSAGVINMAGLLTGLEALGGVVLKTPSAGEWVWKCRKCKRAYPENTPTGINGLSVYRNPSGIVARACHDCHGVLDLVMKEKSTPKKGGEGSKERRGRKVVRVQ